MFEQFDNRFFKALKEAAEAHLGNDHPCALAAGHAVRSAAPSEIAAVQEQLAALDDETSGTLMEMVHKMMREDPEALLAAWSGPANPGRLD